MDQIQAMRIFVRVVEAGTFTRAADSLSLPKATVTKHVQALEERLRVKLLNRTTRRVTVTPDGAAYYDRTVRLLTDLDDIEASMTNARANPRGRLRIDVGTSVAQLLIIPHLAEFHARYPDIQVDLGVSDRMVDLIGDNVDCVLRGGEVTDPSLVVRHVGDLQLGVYAAPSYLQRAGTPQHPGELDDTHHRTVGFMRSRSGKVAPIVMQRDGEHLEVQGRHVVAVDDGNAYLAAGVAGLGVLWLPQYMANEHAARGELVPLFDGWRVDAMPMYVAFPPNRHVSAKLRAFIDWVVELMAVHAPLASRPGKPNS